MIQEAVSLILHHRLLFVYINLALDILFKLSKQLADLLKLEDINQSNHSSNKETIYALSLKFLWLRLIIRRRLID